MTRLALHWEILFGFVIGAVIGVSPETPGWAIASRGCRKTVCRSV